jgi:hypothetical protein
MEELRKYPPAELDCGKLDTDDSNWMLEAPFDTSADNLYDYFLTQEENNLTETLYEYASEAVDDNLSIVYIFD